MQPGECCNVVNSVYTFATHYVAHIRAIWDCAINGHFCSFKYCSYITIELIICIYKEMINVNLLMCAPKSRALKPVVIEW